jgi:predicted ABC-type ATPase
MKAGIFFTGTGPILILTSYESLDDPKLVEKLALKRIKKYIAYEIQEDLVKQKYGKHFDVILSDLKQTDDLRVLDYDGHHVFYSFSIDEIGEPIYHEAKSE